ncbi:MAG: hypothetical protein WC500_02570 [Candidatus Margulisiibacteriota bacterium]
MVNLKKALKTGSLINLAILFNWVLLFIVDPIYKMTGWQIFFFGFLLISLFLSIFVLILPVLFVMRSKEAENFTSIYLSFGFTVVIFVIISMVLFFVSPSTIASLGMSGYFVFIVLLFVVGHIAAFIIQLIKYFRQRKNDQY